MGTVFTDKRRTQLGPNSRPGEIDPYMEHYFICIIYASGPEQNPHTSVLKHQTRIECDKKLKLEQAWKSYHNTQKTFALTRHFLTIFTKQIICPLKKKFRNFLIDPEHIYEKS